MKELQCLNCREKFYSRNKNHECPECESGESIRLDGFSSSRHRKRYLDQLKEELQGYKDLLSEVDDGGRIKWTKMKIQEIERELELRTGGVRTRGPNPDNDRGLEVYS